MKGVATYFVHMVLYREDGTVHEYTMRGATEEIQGDARVVAANALLQHSKEMAGEAWDAVRKIAQV